MPLPMVHLAVAHAMLDAGFEAGDVPGFYLGALSPDAIHQRPGTGREEKNRTHLVPAGEGWGETGLNGYLGRVLALEGGCSTGFLWGYRVHLLTDKIWNSGLFGAFQRRYAADPVPLLEAGQAYYHDADALDQWLYEQSPWREKVWRQLAAAWAVEFAPLLTAGEIDAWRTRTLGWYEVGAEGRKGPPRYLTRQDIAEFLQACSATVLRCIA